MTFQVLTFKQSSLLAIKSMSVTFHILESRYIVYKENLKSIQQIKNYKI